MKLKTSFLVLIASLHGAAAVSAEAAEDMIDSGSGAFAVPALALAEKPHDVTGWEGVPWGATESETMSVLDRYPTYASEGDTGFSKSCTKSLVETPFDYLGQRFDALQLCFFDGELRSVFMTKEVNGSDAGALLAAVQNRLEVKFGPVTRDLGDSYLAWTFPSTHILLSIGGGSVNLGFRAPPAPSEE